MDRSNYPLICCDLGRQNSSQSTNCPNRRSRQLPHFAGLIQKRGESVPPGLSIAEPGAKMLWLAGFDKFERNGLVLQAAPGGEEGMEMKGMLRRLTPGAL